LDGSNIRESCEESGITVYAYYNKYKKIFEEEGIDAIAIDETIAVESKHQSIEEKTKIYDIINCTGWNGAVFGTFPPFIRTQHLKSHNDKDTQSGGKVSLLNRSRPTKEFHPV